MGKLLNWSVEFVGWEAVTMRLASIMHLNVHKGGNLEQNPHEACTHYSAVSCWQNRVENVV